MKAARFTLASFGLVVGFGLPCTLSSLGAPDWPIPLLICVGAIMIGATVAFDWEGK